MTDDWRGNFERAVARLLAPRLHTLGFTRRRLLWNRRQGTQVQAVEMQRSRNNTALAARFTVNLGTGRAPPGTWLRPMDCPGGGQRIGLLRPGRTDQWWRHDPTDPAETEAAVAAALADIEAHGLPFLERGGREAPGWLATAAAPPSRFGRLRAWLRPPAAASSPPASPGPPCPAAEPEPWNGLRDVARGAVQRAAREVAGASPKLSRSSFHGAIELDPNNLAVVYAFATDTDLAEALSNGLRARLRELTVALLALRGYPPAALEAVGIDFVSDEQRLGGGKHWQEPGP